jgi:hypothetical protein
MKKSLIGLSLMFATSVAFGADISVLAGHDNAFHKDTAGVAVGTEVAGLAVAGEFSFAKNLYSTYGASVGKDFKVGGLAVGPRVSVTRVNMEHGTGDGYVAGVGLAVAYPLTKKVSVVGSATHNVDIQKHGDLRGNVVAAGLKYTF